MDNKYQDLSKKTLPINNSLQSSTNTIFLHNTNKISPEIKDTWANSIDYVKKNNNEKKNSICTQVHIFLPLLAIVLIIIIIIIVFLIIFMLKSEETNVTMTTTTPGELRITTTSLKYTRYYRTTALLTNGNVLVTDGYSSGRLNTFNLYDPLTGMWRSSGNMTSIRFYHITPTLTNEKVLATGGLGTITYLNSAELYDPSTEQWKITANMSYAKSLHTASVLANGNVLITGGQHGSTSLNSSQLYKP